MDELQQTLLIIRGIISSLPPEEQKICNDLSTKLKSELSSVDYPLATISLALVGAEWELGMDKEIEKKTGSQPR